MIFATVGTHEQPFDRLVRCLDELKGSGALDEDVMIQTGYASYEPQYCRWSKWISYQEMIQYTREARIVITHGGPASMSLPLQMGKIPVVVPRWREFKEHVNDHQLDFVRAIEARRGQLIPVYDIEMLSEVIIRYDNIVASMPTEMKSNNARFNARLDEMVQGLL